MEELKTFWEGLAPGDKHLTEKKGWAEFIFSELISRIKEPIHSVVDWGPGGGWVAKQFDPSTFIRLVDIVQESLDAATQRLRNDGFTKISQYLIPPNVGINNLPGVRDIDVLMCMLVINHFPNLAYYKQVAEVWKSLKPKYIIIHQRNTPQTVESSNFVDYQKHYGSGLTLSTEDARDPFLLKYNELYHTLESSTFGKWNTPGYEFFIFKRK